MNHGIRILSLGAAALLAACGGSSGGGAPYIDVDYAGPTTTVTLDSTATAGAMVTAAQDGVGIFVGADDTSAVTGAAAASAQVGVRTALGALARARRAGTAVVAGVTDSQSYPCAVSGSVISNATYSDPAGMVLTPGDSMSVTFAACDDGYGVTAGTMSITVTACPDGAEFIDPTLMTPGVLYGMRMVVSDFVSVDAFDGSYSGLDGDMTVALVYTEDLDGFGGWLTSSITGSAVAFEQGHQEPNPTGTGFTAVAVSQASIRGIGGGLYSMEAGEHFPIDLYDWPDVYSSEVSARICSTEMGATGGCLNVETTSPILVNDYYTFPYAGTIQFSDDAGHYVRITATDQVTGAVTVVHLIGAGPEATAYTTWSCLALANSSSCFL